MSIESLFEEQRRKRLLLKRGRERAVANRHPWIFAGAIARDSGPADAAIADLVDESGHLLASGFYSPYSQIRLRALTFGGEQLTSGLLRHRIREAIARRGVIFDDSTNAARLVNADGDELSGLIVDRYDDVAVIEIANRGLQQVKTLVADEIRAALRPRIVFFKNDLPVRRLEQLEIDDAWEGDGEPLAQIRESGHRFAVDPREGQKTGFFLDQRENRRLAQRLSDGKRVLNLFSYSGAFGVYAAAGGAHAVENVDISARAVELAKANHALNGVADRASFVTADAFAYVRERSAANTRFDFIICDPPAFAKSRGEVDRAARGYKDINLHAMRLVETAGMMMTFSCSGHMSLDLFQKVIFAAALDAGRRVAVVARLTAGADHPVSLYCPEGEYLKGFLIEIH